MLAPMFVSHCRRWWLRAGLAALLTLLLAACGSDVRGVFTGTPMAPPGPTDTPMPPLRPTDTPTADDTPAPLVLPVIPLPDDIIGQAEQIVKQKGLQIAGSWAPELTTLYALPGPGLIYVLNTFVIPDALRTVDQAVSGKLDGVALGVLYVTDAAADLPDDYLKPGTYVISLGSGGGLVNFSGQEAGREVQADIRTFKNDPVAARPFGLISSEQLCLSWGALQVCARQRTPLPGALQVELQKAADKLGVSRGFFATERGILDIEGVNNLQRCAEAVKAQQFQDCQPSILVAPVNREGLQAPPPPEFDPLKSGKVPLASLPLAPRLETGQAGLIGVAVVFTDTIEEIYRDAQLTQRAPSLPADAYLLYDILFASDPQIGVNDGQPITLSRVELRISPALKYYLPDVRNIPLLGSAVTGAPPADEESEAAAVHLLLRIFGRQICVFKARECPNLRNTN